MCMLNNKRFYQFIWREQYLQTFTERKLWVGLLSLKTPLMRGCPHFSLIAASRKPVLAFQKDELSLVRVRLHIRKPFFSQFLRKDIQLPCVPRSFRTYMKPVCCFRFLWTHKTYLGNSYRELFCSFLCTGNVPEVLLWNWRWLQL